MCNMSKSIIISYGIPQDTLPRLIKLLLIVESEWSQKEDQISVHLNEQLWPFSEEWSYRLFRPSKPPVIGRNSKFTWNQQMVQNKEKTVVIDVLLVFPLINITIIENMRMDFKMYYINTTNRSEYHKTPKVNRKRGRQIQDHRLFYTVRE